MRLTRQSATATLQSLKFAAANVIRAGLLIKGMLNHRALNLLFRALAHPTRRHLFERLCDNEDSVSALTEPLPISLPAVLQHLAVLERCGLIHTDKRQQTRWCSIEPQALHLLEQWLREHRGYWEAQQRRR